jgi:uncharacterized membrane protein
MKTARPILFPTRSGVMVARRAVGLAAAALVAGWSLAGLFVCLVAWIPGLAPQAWESAVQRRLATHWSDGVVAGVGWSMVLAGLVCVAASVLSLRVRERQVVVQLDRGGL